MKLPSAHIEQKDAHKAYEGHDWSTQAERVRHVVKSCFNGRRIVVFSGGAAKGADAVYQDAIDVRDGRVVRLVGEVVSSSADARRDDPLIYYRSQYTSTR